MILLPTSLLHANSQNKATNAHEFITKMAEQGRIEGLGLYGGKITDIKSEECKTEYSFSNTFSTGKLRTYNVVIYWDSVSTVEPIGWRDFNDVINILGKTSGTATTNRAMFKVQEHELRKRLISAMKFLSESCDSSKGYGF